LKNKNVSVFLGHSVYIYLYLLIHLFLVTNISLSLFAESQTETDWLTVHWETVQESQTRRADRTCHERGWSCQQPHHTQETVA